MIFPHLRYLWSLLIPVKMFRLDAICGDYAYDATIMRLKSASGQIGIEVIGENKRYVMIRYITEVSWDGHVTGRYICYLALDRKRFDSEIGRLTST